MHICHVITRLIIGGAQENTLLTCRGLVERGHRVTLIAGPQTGPEGSLWDDAERCGAALIRLDSMVRNVHPWKDCRAYAGLIGILRHLQPDVVHTHCSKAGILGRLAAARAGVPMIVHSIHGMSFNRTQPWVVRRFYRGLERRAARATTKFISVANAMTDQAVAARIAPQDRFVTIYSGMETDRFAPDPAVRERVRREWGINDGEIVVGTIARLFKNKGYDDILAALPMVAAANPKLRFVWVGGGAYRERYERRLSQLGLRDRVHLTGLVPPETIPHLLNGFDILVHASLWEGLPRAVVQALLTEVPVVCYDNDGAPEVVLSGQTGILVHNGRAAELAAAVGRLANEPQLRREFGRAGRTRYLAMFDERAMVSAIEQAYGASS